jgi:nucleoside-diphosphate-sugar epimerase
VEPPASTTGPEVVVFGGTGFIGSHLAQRLLSAGCRVRIASRRPAGRRDPAGRFRWFQADVADYPSVERAIDGTRVVFHLATGGGDSWTDIARDFVDGTRNVALACQRLEVGRLVYTSSIAALYLGGAGLIDETTDVDSEPSSRNYYSQGKIAAERLLKDMHARDGLRVVIMRPGIVVGPGGPLQHAGLGTWPSDTCCVGWGRGDTPLPFVLVRDVVQALELAMRQPAVDGMTFNLAGDVRLTAAEFVRLVAVCSRRNVRFRPQRLAVRWAFRLATWAVKHVAGRADNVLTTPRELRSATLRTQIDCSLASRVLGWRPNADLDTFVEEAILANVRPIPDGDLRLSGRGVAPWTGR